MLPPAQARIVRADFEGLLRTVNVQFAYVLDVQELEGRHWNNDGVMEDIATGSGAGTVGAYLTKHGRIRVGDEFIIRQGRFLGRPSEIRVRSEGAPGEITRNGASSTSAGPSLMEMASGI